MVLRALQLRTGLGLGTCARMKVRARVGGEAGLRAHQPLGSFHSHWIRETQCKQGRGQVLLCAGRALNQKNTCVTLAPEDVTEIVMN